jgi:hypothetical protein
MDFFIWSVSHFCLFVTLTPFGIWFLKAIVIISDAAQVSYPSNFGPENEDIGAENTYFWDTY